MSKFNGLPEAATLDYSPVDGDSFVAALTLGNLYHFAVDVKKLREIKLKGLTAHLISIMPKSAWATLMEDFEMTDPYNDPEDDNMVSSRQIHYNRCYSDQFEFFCFYLTF